MHAGSARHARHLVALLVTVAAAALACSSPEKALPAASSASSASSSSAPSGSGTPGIPDPPSASAPDLSPTVAPSGGPSPEAGQGGKPFPGEVGAADDRAPVAVDNAIEPVEGPELQQRAKQLFEAIARNEPELAEGFWFPKEPFVSLKDVKGAASYWDNLHRVYGKDIQKLHRAHPDWSGATFDRYEVGSKPMWVRPGEEGNKIGYFRSFSGKLRYSLEGKERSLEVRVAITWQGRWYITHLSKFKK